MGLHSSLEDLNGFKSTMVTPKCQGSDNPYFTTIILILDAVNGL